MLPTHGLENLEKKEALLALPSALPTTGAAPANGNGHVPNEALRSSATHPFAHLAGKYNDEPLWDDFLQAMQDVRRQMNAQEEDAEKPDVHSGLG